MGTVGEAWSRLPREQERLYDLINQTDANGVVFVSGDRHTAFLYRKDGVLPYPAYELTASSLNASFAETTEEMDSAQIGAGYPPENFGAIDIDWATGTAALSIKANDGANRSRDFGQVQVINVRRTPGFACFQVVDVRHA